MLVGSDPVRFITRAILPLARRLLKILVGNLKARLVVENHEVQPVAGREVPRIGPAEIPGRGSVGEITQHGRIEIAVREGSANIGAEGVVTPAVLRRSHAVGGAEAAAGRDHFPVQPLGKILERVDLHHAAELSAVFRRVVRGHDGDGVHFTCFHFRREGGRAIVGERNAIHHELSLIFGAARVQYAIGFEQPARFGIHQVNDRASGKRDGAVLYGVLINAIHRAGAVRIDQRFGVLHNHRSVHRRHAKRHMQVDRNRGANLEGLRHRRKIRAPHLDSVNAEGQEPGDQVSRFVGCQALANVIGIAHEIDRALQAEPARVRHFQAQFAAVALRENRHPSEKEKHGQKTPGCCAGFRVSLHPETQNRR